MNPSESQQDRAEDESEIPEELLPDDTGASRLVKIMVILIVVVLSVAAPLVYALLGFEPAVIAGIVALVLANALY